MKKRILWLIGITLCVVVPISFAASKEVEIQVLKALDFGTIKAAPVDGSISLSPSQPPLVTTTGGVFAVSGGARKSCRVKIKGQKDTLVYLDLQPRTQLVSAQGKTLELDLTINEPVRNLGRSGVITDVFIGGTLNVDANAQAGDYSGDFVITVDYQ